MIWPFSKIAVPAPVPSVSTISTPLPWAAPKPCTSASFRTRTGFFHCLARAFCRSKPAHNSVPRWGAVSTRPLRTAPGNPTETRSNAPSGAAAASIVAVSTSGATGGIGVGTRMFLPIIRPLPSSKASLTPVPPISTARVRGPSMAPSRCECRPTIAQSTDYGHSLARRANGAARRRIAAISAMILPAMAFPDFRHLVRPIVWATAIFGAVLATVPARAAAPNIPAEPVKARLVPETASIAPGTTLWVDLHLDIAPGWHTYWRNPGDAGLPTEIAWTLPAGFTAGDIVWPAPEHFVVDGLGNYGYRDAVDLLVPIAVPPDVEQSGTANFAAAVSWLVCSDICIPGEAKLALALPVGASPASPDPAVKDLFAAARRHLPKPAGFEARFAMTGNEVRLILPKTAFAGLDQPGASFFPFDANMIDAAADPKLQRRGDNFELPLARANTPAAIVPAALDGVLVLRGANAA